MCNSIILAVLANAVTSAFNHTLGDPDQYTSTGRQARIVGGQDIKITSAPYQISLQHQGEHQCGGSIISKYWVLTAGHCVHGVRLKYISVRAGSNYVNNGGTIHKASAAILHTGYDAMTFDYDIAVVKVQPPFSIGKNLKVVKLPKQDFTAKEGTDGLVSGWGTLSPQKKMLPTQLQAVSLPIISRRKCQRSYIFLEITKRMVCAGFVQGRKDACQGDSGGPLVAEGMLVGIVSWGLGCATPGYLGVYSNVAFFRSWIKKKTGV